MRELLEKWTRLEPDRCYEVEYGDGTATAVTVAGDTLYIDSPGRVKADQGVSRALILAATIEAIEARGYGWALVRAQGVEGMTALVERYHIRKPGTGETPDEALLAAYLAALEAEGAS